MPYDLIWFLLPVAAASGWWMASRQSRNKGGRPQGRISADYYKGINYFLNEQPDKAIDVFIHMLELDSDTVEPHLALGNLFRRRGEVDRAIRIHQNLIARPTLDKMQRDQALLELGHDYLQAGLFDRAESLLEELVDRDSKNLPALRLLRTIYEQEHEWLNVINVARKIDSSGQERLRHIVAQYYCEIAAENIRAGDFAEAKKMLRRGLTQHPDCGRALILQIEMDDRKGSHRAVIKSCRRLLQQSPAYLADVIEMMIRAYGALNRQKDMESYVESIINEQMAIHPVLLYCDYLLAEQDARLAAVFLERYLEGHPSLQGLQRLLLFQSASGGDSDVTGVEKGQVSLSILGGLLENSPLYICNNCGFSAMARDWQCPGCRQWETIDAVAGYVPGRENQLKAG